MLTKFKVTVPSMASAAFKVSRAVNKYNNPPPHTHTHRRQVWLSR